MCRLNKQRDFFFFFFFTKPVTSNDALWNNIRIGVNANKKPDGNQSGTQNQTTSSVTQNQTSPSGTQIHTTPSETQIHATPSGTQIHATPSGTENQTSPNRAEIPKNELYGQGDDGRMYSTPTMVFSVIGDSDSFVPRPWPTTLFQKALIEAAKSGGGMIIPNSMNPCTKKNKIN